MIRSFSIILTILLGAGLLFYLKLVDFKTIHAETKKEEGKIEKVVKDEDKNTSEVSNVKTDLDELKYDYTDEEIEALLELNEKAKNLEVKKRELKDSIAVIESDILRTREELEGYKKQNTSLKNKFDEKFEAEEDNLNQLVKTYESMKPVEAAMLILNHDIKMSSKLMDLIKPAQLGKIYSEMVKINKNKTVAITQIYTGFNTRYTKELMKQEITKDDLSEGVNMPVASPQDSPAAMGGAPAAKAETTSPQSIEAKKDVADEAEAVKKETPSNNN